MRITGPVSMFIARRVRQIRVSKELTIREIANRTGIPSASYSCLESGYYRLSLDNLWRILRALDADIGDVWLKSDKKEKLDSAGLEWLAEREWERWRQADARLVDVLEAVCDSFEIDVDALKAHRKRSATMARAACGLLVKATPQLTIAELCRYVGREASTLSHMMKRYGSLVEAEPESDFARQLKLARETLAESGEETLRTCRMTLFWLSARSLTSRPLT